MRGEVLGDRLSRAIYSTDASIYQMTPLCVVLPKDGEDVAGVISYANDKGISVTARGAGTGLAGESLGCGIMLDMSRFMNRIVKIDADANEATVEPGVVLDHLNQRLAPLGKQVGPDPSTDNYATLGGMIGNNSTGAHSLKYGYLGHYLRTVWAVAADGQKVKLGMHEKGSWSGEGLAGQWAGRVHDLLSRHRELMDKVRPRSDRNGSGYNVYRALVNGKVNLAELLAGSEGTLAVVSQATIGLVDRPAVKGMLQVNFASLGNMARAVPHILMLEPGACELMDGTLLRMARQAYPLYHDVLPGDAAASLLVEFDGASESEVQEKLRQGQQKVENLPASSRCMGMRQITASALQARVWAARKAAVPLLFREKKASQPIPVIEDVAVNPAQLAEYLDGLEEITKRLGVPIAYYAHAGHGEMHPRPYFDLHRPEEVKKFRQLADEVFKLAWSLGGTISGEHGEGLVRVSFIKKQYGAEMYEVFREVKRIFDPHNTLNPGKIINDDVDVMVKNLRVSYAREGVERQSNLIFRDDELVREIEQCNGDGLCKSLEPLLSMCPIYRASGDECASPRAKVNLMRHWLYGLLDAEIMQSDEFRRVVDLCVNCKLCTVQCPSSVNVPKLMLEARAEYVKHRGLKRAEYVLTRGELMSRCGSALGPVANTFLQAGWFRRLLQLATDLDHRRAMPRFAWGSNVKRLRRYVSGLAALERPVERIAYFVDLYATYNDHELGRAVVDVLRHNNIEVIIPEQVGAAMVALSYGDLEYARKSVEYNVKHLAEAVRGGYKIVCSEPTAALCLKEEYLDLVDSDDAHRVAEASYELSEFLAGLHKQGQLQGDFRKLPVKLAYHVPCHYQALQIDGGWQYLLKLIDGVEIEHLPNSCCGIAGTFGFQKKNFELSMRAGEPMLGPLRESDADYGLTECGTCKMQMELATSRQVLHPIKVLAKAYGLLK